MGITIDQLTQIDQVQLVDSNGNLGTIKAASTAAAAADTSYVVALSPNSPIPAGSNNIGAINQGTAGASPWVENLTQVGGSAIALGQTTMSASFPVTIASNQSALSVTQGTTPWTVQGDSASGATAAGNPVQIGGVFNTTQPTVTTGQSVQAQSTARGAQIVATGVDAFAVNASQTGTWTVQPGNTANTTPWLVTVSTALPAGSNTIGAVTQASGPWTMNLTQVGGSAIALGQTTMSASLPVTIASNQSAIPVSQSGTWNIGTLTSITNTVTVSGTVTANQGTPNTLANAWYERLTDGTNGPVAVKPSNSVPVTTDPALVVSLSPNSAGLTVSGSVSAAQSGPWFMTQSGTWTVQPGNIQNTVPWLVTQTGSLPGGSNTIGAVNQGTSPWLTKDAADGPVSPGAAASYSILAGMVYNSGTYSPTSGQQLSLQSDSVGNLKVNIAAGSITATNPSVGSDGATPPTSETLMGGSVTTSSPTYATGQMKALSLTTAGALRVDGSAVTQPISGTVTSNQGTANSLANAWSMKITDATNGPAAVKAASTAAAATDPALVVAVSPNNSVAVTQATASNLNAQVVGNVASGSADSGNGVKVSGVYNTTVPALTNGQRGDIQVDSRGAQIVTLVDGVRQTYSAEISDLAAPGNGDQFVISGSASKVIRITRIELSGVQTTAGVNDWRLAIRSTADTGGTSTTLTAVPHDSNNAAATASVKSYTVVPTAGTLVGYIRGAKIFMGTSSGSSTDRLIWDFGDRPAQCPVLRGTAQSLALYNDAALTGASMYISIEWTEE